MSGFDFLHPLILALIGLALVIVGAFFYRMERSDGEDRLRYENAALRSLVAAMLVCMDDDADARECPLYDENEPHRCAMKRVLWELGLRNDG